jgi:Undecaprenyl-phosphate galactose phosphotransferase WbaP
MSVAAVQQTAAIAQCKQRSWAGLMVVLADILALEVALAMGCIARYVLRSIFPIQLGAPQYQGLALAVLILPLAYYWVGVYPGYGMSAVQRIRARVYATFTVFMVLLSWNYAFQDRQWSRGVLVFTMLFALVLTPAVEALVRKFFIARGLCGTATLILGAGHTGMQLALTLQKERDLGFVPVGFLDDDPTKWGTALNGIPILGPLSMAGGLCDRAKVAIVAMPEMNRARLANLVESLTFPNVIVVPNLFGIQSLWITSRDLGGMLGLEVRKNLLVPSNRFLKRLLDLAICVPAGVLSAPFIGLSALWIKIVSPGPAFFIQEREGKDGKRIRVYKLRTMHHNAVQVLQRYLAADPVETANWRRYYKLKRDPRVIRGIGWFLRRYSLDELPQLWNVLKGDMSLVGPRPFPEYHLENFSAEFRALRASVMPGVTGFWQVSARSDGDLQTQEAEDTYYIRNWSLWLDIYILLRTIRTFIMPNAAY